LDTNTSTNLKIVSNAVGAKITQAVYRQAYTLEVGGIEFFFVGEQRTFLLFKESRRVMWTIQPYIQMAHWGS